MANLVVLIDGKETNISEDKLKYFQDVLGAELVTGMPDKKEKTKNKKHKK